MANIVNFDLTFTDNSTGVRDEDGTEVQIYTDSPSFVPNVSVDHTFASHPWMALPLIGAGITTIPIALESPLTYVKVRVRQFNENGFGAWNTPGGGAGELFTFTTSATVDAPDAPSAVGLIVVATPTQPVDPPIEEPPDPEPPDETVNFAWPSQFSGTQGSSGWSYEDNSSGNLTYDTGSGVWRHASSAFLSIWSGGFHPGPSTGAMLQWTVPNTGIATITGNWNLYMVPGGGRAVTLAVKKNLGGNIYVQSSADTTVFQFSSDPDLNNISVNAGDTLSFIVTADQVNNSNCSTQLTVNIALTAGGVATDPVVSNITPATLAVNTGTVNSVTVNLSGAALTNSTVVLDSTNDSVATVPASVLIPTGQSSGIFNITAVGAGSATISAEYNSSTANCAVTVSTPPAGGQWPNEPAGMTIITNSSFSDSLGSEWYNVYNTQAYASPSLGGQSFSPPRAFDVYRDVGSYYGNGEWGLNYTNSSEIYVGFYWGTNSSFQGYANNTNKMVFVRDGQTDNSFIVWQGLMDSPKTLKWYQQAQVNNTHIPTVFNTNYPTDGTGWFENNINNSAAIYTAGQPMRFIELYLKKSTTTTSQNGIIRWWVNGTMCGSYTNANISPLGFVNMAIAPSWDGGGAPSLDLSRSWHHYFDHLRMSRKA